MEYYQYVLILHIMAFMSWMACMFYLPRLFVYHAEHMDKKDFVDVVEIQEYKLYKYISVPAMIATVLSGGYFIVVNPALLSSGGWLHAKLLLVLLLIIYDASMNRYRKQLLMGTCTKSGKFFRAYNEIPTWLSVLLVTYVILKDVPIYFTIAVSALFVYIFYFLISHAKEPNLRVVEDEKKKMGIK